MVRPSGHLLVAAALLLALLAPCAVAQNQNKYKTRGFKTRTEAAEAAKKLAALVSPAKAVQGQAGQAIRHKAVDGQCAAGR